MTAFYGSPEGKSAAKKFGPYMAGIMPQIQQEVKKAMDEKQKQSGPKDQPEAGAPTRHRQPAKPAAPRHRKPRKPKADQGTASPTGCQPSSAGPQPPAPQAPKEPPSKK